jgi:hypothetical protein
VRPTNVATTVGRKRAEKIIEGLAVAGHCPIRSKR